jgi:hypothetical protein
VVYSTHIDKVTRVTRRPFPLKQIEQALRVNGGIQAAAAEALAKATGKKVQPQLVNDAAKRHPELQQAIQEAEEASLDLVESTLPRTIDAGKVNAIKFYLETKGKWRGTSIL